MSNVGVMTRPPPPPMNSLPPPPRTIPINNNSRSPSPLSRIEVKKNSAGKFECPHNCCDSAHYNEFQYERAQAAREHARVEKHHPHCNESQGCNKLLAKYLPCAHSAGCGC